MIIDLDKLSKLANLPITQPVILAKDLEEITKHFSVIDELDTDNIEPTFQVNHLKNVFREDKVIKTAPIIDGYFMTHNINKKNG